MKNSRLKRISINFGIICGMIITACSAFNAVMGSVKEYKIAFASDVADEVLSSADEGFYLEQRIHGEIPEGTTITKGVTFHSETKSIEDDYDGIPVIEEPPMYNEMLENELAYVTESALPDSYDDEMPLWIWFAITLASFVGSYVLLRYKKSEAAKEISS